MNLLDLLSYPRAAIVFVIAASYTLVMSVIVLLVALTTGNQRWIDFLINRCWAYPLVQISGLKVDVRGREFVQQSPQGFLLLFNHSSYLDILLLYAYFPRSFRFGAKIELFRVPFFGRAMRACGILPIDRRNRAEVMRIYEEAITRVNRGESFALAPEGTRQTEPILGKFKRGPFEFAINAQMDVVPVVMAGAFAALPRMSVWVNLGHWRRRVIIEILPPVSTKTFRAENVAELAEHVRREMEPVHNRLYQELAADPGF